ncbi:MAG TPA: hypothetical protein DDZ51_08005 [Planctomycetaceae bacterium]|nr:hypothetical protein [Planctomycetaceae bacterium]
MRILIVEEALRAGNGHWPRYIADLATGFRREGDTVDILGHRDANEKVLSVVLDVTPWLSRDCRVDPRSIGFLGGIRHNWSHYRDLSRWLRSNSEYDWILSLSSRPKHLLAYVILAQRFRRHRTKFLLLFVLSPGKRNAEGEIAWSLSNVFAKSCFKLLRLAASRGQVVIAAETDRMRAEIQDFCGLPTTLFPHPVDLPIAKDQQSATLTRDHRQANKTIRIVAPGLARHEKGSDLLQAAIKIWLARHKPEEPTVKFILQWPEPFPLPNGEICAPDPQLTADGHVEFCTELLTGDSYVDFLRQADLIVLPYRAAAYQARVSRVAIEAAMLGKPIIYTEQTWIREVADRVGTGVAFTPESPEAISEAISKALDRIDELKHLADRGSQHIRNFYTTSKFRGLLCDHLASSPYQECK